MTPSGREIIVSEIREQIDRVKNLVVTGEVGVGKIVHTLDALHDTKPVYYVGNPYDYIGQSRPQGYEQYLKDVTTQKPDLVILSSEKELLTLKTRLLCERAAIVIIDEVFGRSPSQCDKLTELLGGECPKIVLITGCLRNAVGMLKHFDRGLLLSPDSFVRIEKEFLVRLGNVLRPEASTGTPSPGQQPDSR